MGPRRCALSLLGFAAFAASGVTAERIRVNVDKLTFTPAQVSAHVGDTIEWVSADFVAHTATARNKEWDVAIPAERSGRITLKHTGFEPSTQTLARLQFSSIPPQCFALSVPRHRHLRHRHNPQA